MQSYYEQHVSKLTKLGIPLVLLARSASDDLCWVSGDDMAGGRLAMEHLLGRGHRRVAVVGGVADNHHVQARVRGARSAMPPAASITVVPTQTYEIRAGVEAADMIMAMPVDERPDGVFAVNDLIGIGLESRLLSRGSHPGRSVDRGL